MNQSIDLFGFPATFNPRPIDEKEFMGQVKQLALMTRWKWYHTFDSRRSDPGFPDTVMVRDRTIFCELKREDNEATREQVIWINALRKAGELAFIWKPSDMPEIVRLLSAPERWTTKCGDPYPVPEPKPKRPKKKMGFR